MGTKVTLKNNSEGTCFLMIDENSCFIYNKKLFRKIDNGVQPKHNAGSDKYYNAMNICDGQLIQMCSNDPCYQVSELHIECKL